MAHAYGVDTDEARAAGLLHDWDKCFSDEELIARAKKFGIKLMKHHEDTAPLLHAQTGAAAVAAQYPELPKSVIQAIERHTSAAPDMQPLDMIIYIADMIEPLRTQGNLEPLRKLAGNAPLEALFVKCYEVTMQHLISRHRFIHPDSIKVWNAYVSKERSTAEKAAQSLRDVKIDV
jgi:predicted HD superfamily hydrolase involved in NAD metabolism